MFFIGKPLNLLLLYLIVVCIKKRMLCTVGFVAGHCVQANRMNAFKNAFFNVWICFAKLCKQLLYFLALALAVCIVVFRVRLGKSAGAAYKFKVVVFAPSQNGILMNAIHRPNKLHSLKICAVKLRQHCLNLCSVKHSYKRCFHNIAEVMAKCNFVATKLLCF